MKRYTWFPPLYEKGQVHTVKFSPRERRYTDVRPKEVCTIVEVETKYDERGMAKHFYLVRYNEKRAHAIAYGDSSDDNMAQMVLVPERQILKPRA